MVGDPTEGALLVLAHKAGVDIDATRERYPRLATLPFDPTYKLMAAFTEAADASGKEVVRCYVKGAAPAVMSHASSALSAGQSIPWDDGPARARRGQRAQDGRSGAARDGRRLPRPGPRRRSTPTATCWATSRASR